MRPQANVTCCARDLQYFFNALTASCKSLIVCCITIKHILYLSWDTSMYAVTWCCNSLCYVLCEFWIGRSRHVIVNSFICISESELSITVRLTIHIDKLKAEQSFKRNNFIFMCNLAISSINLWHKLAYMQGSLSLQILC